MAPKPKPKKKAIAKGTDFPSLLADIKTRIQSSQTRAVLAVSAELTQLYWDIGRIIDSRQRHEGWGAAVIPRLASELKNEFPEIKGFSERNIKRMVAFYRDYPNPVALLLTPQATEEVPPSVSQLHASSKVPPPVAQLHASSKVPPPVAQLHASSKVPPPVAQLHASSKVPPPVAQLHASSKVPPSVAQLHASSKVPPPVAQLGSSLLWSIPWAHHVTLMDKIDMSTCSFIIFG
jgi:hypothetical protein